MAGNKYEGKQKIKVLLNNARAKKENSWQWNRDMYNQIMTEMPHTPTDLAPDVLSTTTPGKKSMNAMHKVQQKGKQHVNNLRNGADNNPWWEHDPLPKQFYEYKKKGK